MLRQFEAVRLFVERAVAVQPGFLLAPRNAAAVAAICRHLDGIPLALELAAARVRVLAVTEIAARLSDRFRLLTGGARTALPRQQTLRACIDWSYDLLSVPERTLLRRLAVFAGGWTSSAAEAVCAGGGVGASQVVELLTQLVDKSLAEVDATRGRYRLLETVRQYAQERLDEADDGDGARARHLDYFVAFAEEAGPDLMGPDPAPSLARLADELENLLLAHRQCARVADGAEKDLRLAHAAAHLWHAQGRMELGFGLTKEALTRAGSAASDRLRGKVLGDAAYLSCSLGRYKETVAYAQEKLAIARGADDANGASVAHYWLGAACMAAGDTAGARGHLEDSVALSRELGNKANLAGSLGGLADVVRGDGDLDTARSLYREALELFREAGERASFAITFINLAIVAIACGDPVRARDQLREAAAIAAEIRSKQVEQLVVEILAQLWASHGEWARATRLDAAAAARLEEMGLRRSPVDERARALTVASARTALGEAGFAAAEAAGRAAGFEKALAESYAWLGSPPAGSQAPGAAER
jgi:tetratricopeptide (TPR) repeat protein